MSLLTTAETFNPPPSSLHACKNLTPPASCPSYTSACVANASTPPPPPTHPSFLQARLKTWQLVLLPQQPFVCTIPHLPLKAARFL